MRQRALEEFDEDPEDENTLGWKKPQRARKAKEKSEVGPGVFRADHGNRQNDFDDDFFVKKFNPKPTSKKEIEEEGRFSFSENSQEEPQHDNEALSQEEDGDGSISDELAPKKGIREKKGPSLTKLQEQLQKIKEKDDKTSSFSKKDIDSEIKRAKSIVNAMKLNIGLVGLLIKINQLKDLANKTVFPSAAENSKEVIESAKKLKSSLLSTFNHLESIVRESQGGSKPKGLLGKRSSDSDASCTGSSLNKRIVSLYGNGILDSSNDSQSLHEKMMEWTDSWYNRLNLLGSSDNMASSLSSKLLLKNKLKLVNQTPYQYVAKMTENMEEMLSRSRGPNGDENVFENKEFFLDLLRENAVLSDLKGGENGEELGVPLKILKQRELEREGREKKEVERRASKGRKIRYHEHGKLVNFLVPIQNEEELLGRNEILENLFGKLGQRAIAKNGSKRKGKAEEEPDISII